MFGSACAIEDRNNIPPWEWWTYYGAESPQLQRFAVRVLSQGSSSSPCERNWSSFNHIQSKKRNKLLSTRLENLVYVRSNLKLALNSVAKDSSSSTHPWFEVEPTSSAEENNLGIDGDSSDEQTATSDRVLVSDASDNHISSAFTAPCALDDLDLYDVTSRPLE